MKESTHKALLSDLEGSNFTRSRPLARALQVIPCTEPEFKKLVSEDGFEFERVFRSKFDGDNRPGCHFTLQAHADWCSLEEPLEEAYWQFAAEYDYREVYSIVLTKRDSYERAQNRFSLDNRNWENWNKASWICAMNHGGWVATLDIAHFYREIKPDQLMHLWGSDGLNIDKRLIMAVVSFVTKYETGFPQGSVVSDIAARLALTPFDRMMRDTGIPFDRYVDDIRIYGSSQEEVTERAKRAACILDGHCFKVNPSKSRVQGPERLPWLIKGLFWGAVPIEKYVSDCDFDPTSLYLETEGYGSASTHPWFHVRHEPLFDDEYGAGMPYRSEHGMRFNLCQIGSVAPTKVLEQLFAIVSQRPNSIPFIVPGFTARSDEVLETCFHNAPERSSREDDRLLAIERSNGSTRHDITSAWLDQPDGIFCRAIRQGAFMQLEPDSKTLATVSEAIPPSAWSDELAAALTMSQHACSQSGKAFTDDLISKHAHAGLLREAIVARQEDAGGRQG